MPPVTAGDEPWPFFHFWRHHFWPKLASSMLNFCRRRRSFQWGPDQSDRPNGAWDMHKNAQKVKRKTHTKICCHYTWLLHGKNCPSRWRFLRSLLTASKSIRGSITAAKRKEKEKKKRRKKIPKIEKPKDIGHFLIQKLKILISAHAWVKMSQNAKPVARKPSCCDASAFLTRLKVIWPRSSLKTTKMSKKCLFRKKLRESMG